MATAKKTQAALALRSLLTTGLMSSTRIFSFGSLLVLSDADKPVAEQIVDIDAAMGQMRALKAALLKAAK